MRVAILTSQPRHFASLFVAALPGSPQIDVAAVVLNVGRPGGAASRRRRWSKIRRIGLLAALNGVRMRRWYGPRVAERLQLEELNTLCRRLNLPFATTPRLNGEVTRELFRRAEADVGLSLGNPWIGPKLFSIPRHGMLNVHHELLPRYRGAQAVIWQIHDGSTETGYTIHRIERSIDAGEILARGALDIEFHPTLAETVVHNYARLLQASVDDLLRVLTDYAAARRDARPQGPGGSYTTPTLAQFRRMLRQHRRLARAAGAV